MTTVSFSLPGISKNTEEKNYTLKTCADTPKILLYAYPKDNTPGCSNQAMDFTRLKKEFLDLGITVIGVSPDSIQSHTNFIEKKELDILLLSDPEKILIQEIGAWGEKMNYGKKYVGLIRSTFLIDRESGKILEEWKNVRAKGHGDRMLKILSE